MKRFISSLSLLAYLLLLPQMLFAQFAVPELQSQCFTYSNGTGHSSYMTPQKKLYLSRIDGLGDLKLATIDLITQPRQYREELLFQGVATLPGTNKTKLIWDQGLVMCYIDHSIPNHKGVWVAYQDQQQLWQREKIDGGDVTSCDITVYQDQWVVAYTVASSLKLAKRTDNRQWSLETLFNSSVGSHTSLAIDAQNRLFLATQFQYSFNGFNYIDVKFSYQSNGVWTHEDANSPYSNIGERIKAVAHPNGKIWSVHSSILTDPINGSDGDIWITEPSVNNTWAGFNIANNNNSYYGGSFDILLDRQNQLWIWTREQKRSALVGNSTALLLFGYKATGELLSRRLMANDVSVYRQYNELTMNADPGGSLLLTHQVFSVANGYEFCVWHELDSDLDGLSDQFELGLGSNPNLSDTDSDGTDDGVEVLRSLNRNPLRADVPSCIDGIRNGDEEGIDCGGSCMICQVVDMQIPIDMQMIVDMQMQGGGQMDMQMQGGGQMDMQMQGGMPGDDMLVGGMAGDMQTQNDQSISSMDQLIETDTRIISSMKDLAIDEEMDQKIFKFQDESVDEGNNVKKDQSGCQQKTSSIHLYLILLLMIALKYRKLSVK